MNKISSSGLNPIGNDLTIEATVVSGFENLAKEECLKKLGKKASSARGRICFDVQPEILPKVMELRSIDNVCVIIYSNEQFAFKDTKEDSLTDLRLILSSCLWEKGLKAWQQITGYSKLDQTSILRGIKENSDVCGENTANEPFKFRVTCNRSGKHHSFGSPDAAISFGGAVNDAFGWKADMENFDLEVVLNIVECHIYVGLSLTKKSLHHRNIHKFGPTTLRSTIAYNLLLLAKIQDGDIVCDPMCGSGAIPIEAAICYDRQYHLCGDNHPVAMDHTLHNIHGNNDENAKQNMKQLLLDGIQWDVTNLPLRSNSVDVFVTDLPFGKKSGSKFDNRSLYPKILNELGRVCSSRAVLLTHDRRNFLKALQKCCRMWKLSQQLTVNIGGLAAGVYYIKKYNPSTMDSPAKNRSQALSQ